MPDSTSKVSWRWLLLTLIGLIVDFVAGSLSDDADIAVLILVTVAGVLLGLGLLLFLAEAPWRPSEASAGSPEWPGIGQGCVIVISGALLAFFSCLGALMTDSDRMITFITSPALIAGLVLAVGGFGRS